MLVPVPDIVAPLNTRPAAKRNELLPPIVPPVSETSVGDVWTLSQSHGTLHVDRDQPVLMVAGGYQLKPDLPFIPGSEAVPWLWRV